VPSPKAWSQHSSSTHAPAMADNRNSQLPSSVRQRMTEWPCHRLCALSLGRRLTVARFGGGGEIGISRRPPTYQPRIPGADGTTPRVWWNGSAFDLARGRIETTRTFDDRGAVGFGYAENMSGPFTGIYGQPPQSKARNEKCYKPPPSFFARSKMGER